MPKQFWLKGGLGGYGQLGTFWYGSSGAPQVLNGNIGDNTFYGGKGGTGTYGQNGSEAGGGGGAGGTTENGLNGAGRQGGQGGFYGGGDGAWAGTINCNCPWSSWRDPWWVEVQEVKHLELLIGLEDLADQVEY